MANSHDPTPPPSHPTLPSDLTSTPFLRTSATLSPHAPLSFSTVIEDDHSRINAVVIKLGRRLNVTLNPRTPNSPPPTTQHLTRQRDERLSLLQEATSRLIRHDVSEDLIMRPAFTHYLGREGAEMGEHDRKDHNHAKVQLIQLYEDFERLPLDVSSTSSSSPNSLLGSAREEFAGLAKRFKDLMAELTEHMKVESGMQIPRLESILSREQSEALARRYISTYVLEPEMMVKGKRVWSSIDEYVRERRERFQDLWRDIEEGEERREQGGKL